MKSKSIFNCFVAGREPEKFTSSQSEKRSDRFRKSSVKIESDYVGEIQGKAVRIVPYSQGTQPKKEKVRTSDQRSRVRIVVTDSTLSTKKSQKSKPQGEQQKSAGKKGETETSKPEKSSTNKPFTCIPTLTVSSAIDSDKKKTVSPAIDSDLTKTVSSTDNHLKQTEMHITSTTEIIRSQQTSQTILEPNGTVNNLNTGEKKGCHQVVLVTWVSLIMLCLLLNKWIAVSFSILCFYALPKLAIIAQFNIADGKQYSKKLFAKSLSFD